MISDPTVLTGCDSNFEWILPWFHGNLRKHNPYLRMEVADLGMSLDGIHFCTKNKIKIFSPLDNGFRKKGWFLKPQAIINSSSENVVWIDIDCEIHSGITDIFDYAEEDKLGLTVDLFGGKRAHWATGVILVKGRPQILHDWSFLCSKARHRGDQEALAAMIGKSKDSVVELPQIYQWLRLSLKRGKDNPDKRITHWTGPKGKQYIKSQLS